jgi:hypothetical protein
MVSFNVYFIIVIEKLPCQAWWCMSVILALQKLRQEDCEFEASLSYIVRSCLQKKKKEGFFSYFTSVNSQKISFLRLIRGELMIPNCVLTNFLHFLKTETTGAAIPLYPRRKKTYVNLGRECSFIIARVEATHPNVHQLTNK